MKVDELSTGAIYIDTNVLYMYLRADQRNLQTIKTFLRRIVNGKIEAFTGIPVFDELRKPAFALSAS